MSLVDLGKRLLHASRAGDVDEVRVLMANGAPFTTDWLGTSPLHYAANQGHIPTAEVLLRAGISRDARTKVDRTPLHVACQEGHAAIVDLLLKHGADADARDMLKMSPLHWAVERGHDDCVKVLVNHGADQTIEDKFDRNAYQIAINNQRIDIAESLEAMPTKQSHDPITAITSLETVDDVMNEVTTETINLGDGLTVSASAAAAIPAIRRVTKTKSQKTSASAASSSQLSEQNSTSVLATLAALAEATAPLDTASLPTGVNASEALNWLQEHGITMVTDDGALITSALEGGSTLTLTEAGKLALNFVKNKGIKREHDEEEEEEIVEESEENVLDPSMITIVTGEDGDHQQMLMTVAADVHVDPQTHLDTEELHDDEPLQKRIKLEDLEEENVEEVAIDDNPEDFHSNIQLPSSSPRKLLKPTTKIVLKPARNFKMQPPKEKEPTVEAQVRKSTRKIIKKVIKDFE
ncbi:uncharacterized protein LOC141914106 [Tubulanus polymorphus]|uniref:uncharacterized protein LOC141914106 n=1 Tax=Tubulanus polymorphus TaxID=672921 RepID=UPI003DA2B89D